MARLQVGDGLAEGSVLGPLIDGNAVAKVEAHVADAAAKGRDRPPRRRRHALGGNF